MWWEVTDAAGDDNSATTSAAALQGEKMVKCLFCLMFVVLNFYIFCKKWSALLSTARRDGQIFTLSYFDAVAKPWFDFLHCISIYFAKNEVHYSSQIFCKNCKLINPLDQLHTIVLSRYYWYYSSVVSIVIPLLPIISPRQVQGKKLW